MEGEPLRIMLVEDNEAHAELVIHSLQSHTIANQITHVSDGEAALDYLYRRGQYADRTEDSQPNVVLLDLRLPRIDGLEVLREVKSSKELHKIPVVVLTTSDADKDVAQAYKYNANSYLVKPIDFGSFTKLMQDLGFYWLSWNHYPWLQQ